MCPGTCKAIQTTQHGLRIYIHRLTFGVHTRRPRMSVRERYGNDRACKLFALKFLGGPSTRTCGTGIPVIGLFVLIETCARVGCVTCIAVPQLGKRLCFLHSRVVAGSCSVQAFLLREYHCWTFVLASHLIGFGASGSTAGFRALGIGSTAGFL